MINGFNLYGMIYDFLTAQIELGVYRAGDRLPNIEEADAQFAVSPDTLRAAYLQMRRNGYIDLRQKAGATVARKYTPAETERHVQEFFGKRRRSLPDIAAATRTLFGDAMCLGLRLAPPRRLAQIEALIASRECGPLRSIMQALRLIYESLGNELLLRLVWQIFMFEVAPFLSLALGLDYAEADGCALLLRMIELRRRGDADGLRAAADAFHTRFAGAIDRFYAERIAPRADGEIAFRWTPYKNTTQLRYSLGPALLAAVGGAEFPVGSRLPSPEKLAASSGVSLSTARRTVRLLERLGAVRAVKGRGKVVLSPADAAAVCDLTDQAVRERMLETLQSLHIFALTCRSVTTATFAVAGDAARSGLLSTLRECANGKIAMYACLRFLADNAPQQAVRDIYAQLLDLLRWGYSLFGLASRLQSPGTGAPPEILRAAELDDGAAFGAAVEDAVTAALRLSAAAFGQAIGADEKFVTY